MTQRHAQLAVADQKQRAGILGAARTQDRREIAVWVTGDDDGCSHARHLDYSARP
jgi:hypothetical protein